jgi:NADPH-dependent F420 reductase
MEEVGILGGTGTEGRGIAARLAAAGYRVALGSRELARAEAAAAALGDRGPIVGVANDVAAGLPIVVLAVPFEHAARTLERYAARFRPGALLVDVTVPVRFVAGRPRLVEVPEGSAAEHVRRHAPPAVAVAAALKVIPARLLVETDAPLDCDDLVCADSDEARARAMRLVGAIAGLRPLDAGSLETCRTIERMTVLAIQLNQRYRVAHVRYRIVGL